MVLLLVDRLDYPEYYDIIDDPIALDVIQSKVDEEQYSSIEQFKDDYTLMCENAFTFNRKR
jgi:hypothetical protein